ncbi:MAG: hypothetical protein B6D37_04050 [Sphingobacteriales bacterium UTBCD1]|jgi:hypothetical protein|nr:MAG: hypothetical protein B6D37_04050 [Sphingobacteriales bacterium UTBCD1]
MKKPCLLIYLIIFFDSLSFAGDGDYAVSKIPQVLLKNADAVVRLQEVRFQVNNTREATEWNHYVITIMKESGETSSGFADYYDKMRDILSVEGILYDSNGRIIKKMKSKDMEDISGVDDNSLMDDSRVKRHNFYYKAYPYTIEYTEVIRYRNTLFFPAWMPQNDEKISVEFSQFSMICPEEYKFRFRSFNYPGEPEVSTDKGKVVTRWSVHDLPAFLEEPNSPYQNEITPCIYFAPTDFQVDNYSGNMNSWQDFGRFVYALKQGRDVLPDNVKTKVHQLSDGITDIKKKIQILYEYMQKHTRYVSIQLGIGGWQPFDATYVANKGYGDCKALTNYMYSILKEAGIPSFYTLVKAGRNSRPILDDFPSQQFNHVILSVPVSGDTVWLECTSQTLPSGYLSDFTCNRKALLINENESKLIHTPVYGLNENTMIRKVSAVLDENETLKVKSVTDYRAMQEDKLHQMIHYLSKEKIKQNLREQLDFGTYEVNSFDYTEELSSLPVMQETLDLTVSNYASATGKRLFIMPNIMTRSSRKFGMNEERKYDIVFHAEYRDIDSAEILIPDGYKAESVPRPVTIESKFGKYSNSVILEGNKIVYYRLVEQYSGRFPAKEYTDAVRFYDNIYQADRSKVVLVKNNSSDQKSF